MNVKLQERAKSFVERKTNMCFTQALMYHGETYIKSMMQSYVEICNEHSRFIIGEVCEIYRKECEDVDLIIKNINPKHLELIDINKSVDTFREKLLEDLIN